MQTIKLNIPGQYYDSQIYSGFLYLWTITGSILTIDWDRLIKKLNLYGSEHLAFAAHCALQKNGNLYREEWQLFFRDSEMRELLRVRFDELAKTEITITPDDLNSCMVREQDSPFPFPHTDSLLHYNRMYVSGQSGIRSTSKGGGKNPLNPKSIKHWDAPVVSMVARHKTLAMAAKSDGVYEAKINPDIDGKMFTNSQRTERHSDSVRWMYSSIFSNSYEGSFVANIYEQRSQHKNSNKQQQDRILKDITSETAIFGSRSQFSWGVHDKICSIQDDQIEVVKYSPMNTEKVMEGLGKVSTNHKLDEIISADSAPFGYVIEDESGLLIINSGLETEWLPGEPINWRVFPETRDYTNHLHIIYEDSICIHTFVQDYFVDQTKKLAGIHRWSTH